MPLPPQPRKTPRKALLEQPETPPARLELAAALQHMAPFVQEGDDRQPPPQRNHVGPWLKTGAAAVAGAIAFDGNGGTDAVDGAEIGMEFLEFGLTVVKGAPPRLGGGKGADGLQGGGAKDQGVAKGLLEGCGVEGKVGHEGMVGHEGVSFSGVHWVQGEGEVASGGVHFGGAENVRNCRRSSEATGTKRLQKCLAERSPQFPVDFPATFQPNRPRKQTGNSPETD